MNSEAVSARVGRSLVANMKVSEALSRLERTEIADKELKECLKAVLKKYDRIQKTIKQNSHIPKRDSDVDAESFRRIRKVVLHT